LFVNPWNRRLLNIVYEMIDAIIAARYRDVHRSLSSNVSGALVVHRGLVDSNRRKYSF
jgi:hypothetical protein